MTTFQYFINFLQKFEVGEIVTRTEIFNNAQILSTFRTTTVDQYRYVLEDNGYLERVKPGNYRVIKKIPINLCSDGRTLRLTPLQQLVKDLYSECEILKE